MNRRTLLAIPALAAATSPAAAAAAHQRPRRPHRIIATEEGFALPETLAATGAYLAQNPTAEPGFARFAPASGRRRRSAGSPSCWPTRARCASGR